MRPAPRMKRLRRLFTCGLLVSYSMSCTSWRLRGLSPQQFVTREHPRVIRVVRSDSTEVVLTEPRVSGDSLTGLTDDGRLSVPISDIASLATPQDDGGKMFALGLFTGAVAALGVVFLIALGNAGGN